MALTASALRQNVYKVLDQVAETGIPVEINRRGRMLRIVSAESIINGNPEDLVHIDWSHLWRP
jgi:prevent-host-death family protein